MGKKYTVVIDSRLIGASGIGTYLSNLIRQFATFEIPFTLKILCEREKLPNESNFEIVPTKSKIFSIAEQFELPRIAKGAELFHSPHHNVPVFWRKKLIVSIFDLIHWVFPEYVPGLKGKFYLRMVASKIRKANAIIVPSQATKNEAIRIIGVPEEKIFVVPLGVDETIFSRRTKSSVETVLKEFGLKYSSYLLYVGHLKPHKNVRNLIKAYLLSRTRGVKIPLILTGQYKELRHWQNIDDLLSENVRYIGTVKSDLLPYLYNGARAFLFPSRYEGFGLPPLEAMACGVPVLCSNSTSLPEVCGDCAIIVNPDDLDSIAEGIVKIVDDDRTRQRLIDKGLANAKRFSWQLTAKRTLQIYTKILEEQN